MSPFLALPHCQTETHTTHSPGKLQEMYGLPNQPFCFFKGEIKKRIIQLHNPPEWERILHYGFPNLLKSNKCSLPFAITPPAVLSPSRPQSLTFKEREKSHQREQLQHPLHSATEPAGDRSSWAALHRLLAKEDSLDSDRCSQEPWVASRALNLPFRAWKLAL